MNKLTPRLVLGLAMLLPFTAQAADNPKIAVLNMGAALFNSERAKQVDEEVRAETAADERKVRELAEQGQELQRKFQQDGATMSAAEQKKLSDEIEAIGVQYQYLLQKLQATVEERRQQFQQQQAPALIEAITEVVEGEKYDIVLRAETVIHFENAYDITGRVTERLNKKR